MTDFSAVQLPLQVRSAVPADVPLVLSLLHQKAAFDRSLNPDLVALQATEQSLHETLFNPSPFAYVLLAELERTAIGFALYYFRYSSFLGRPSLWLDDLFVEPSARRSGTGTTLFKRLVEVAQTHRCTHLGWTAHCHNRPGIKFYQKMGAATVSQDGMTLYFRKDL